MSITGAPAAPPMTLDDMAPAHDRGSEDQQALGALYDRYSSLALGAIVGFAPDRDSAEQAVHRAFVAAWCGVDRFDATRGDLESWLVALARRHVPADPQDR